jgi:hypothetical protein
LLSVQVSGKWHDDCKSEWTRISSESQNLDGADSEFVFHLRSAIQESSDVMAKADKLTVNDLAVLVSMLVGAHCFLWASKQSLILSAP